MNKKDTGRKEIKKLLPFILLLCLLLVAIICLIWKFVSAGKTPARQEVFLVGEETVYLDEVNFCFYQNVTQLRLGADVLEQTMEDGSTGDSYYKNAILKTIMNYKVEDKVARSRGITLDEEEEKQLKVDVADFLKNTNGSDLRELGITQERIEEIYRQRYLADKLEKEVMDDITVDDQKYCTVYIMQFPKVKMDETGDYVRDGDSDMPILLSDEEMTRQKEHAQQALKMLQDGEDAVAVARKFNVELYSGEESNLADSFEEPFVQYTATLKKDECSPVMETESCYAIIKMIKEDNKEIAQQIMGYYKEDMIKEAIQEERDKWYKEAGTTDNATFIGSVWERLTLFDFVKYVEG